MSDAIMIIWFGIVVILLGVFMRAMSYGMPTLQEKPEYPVPRRLRIALVVYGVLVILLGLSRLLPRL